MSETFRELIDAQNNFEQRFSCPICLCPCLRMVYGMCQHRICEDCLYNDGVRRPSFHCCPICNMEDAFPRQKPHVLEENIALQHFLGVRKCPHQDCKTEVWEWELDTHIQTCTKQRPSDDQKRHSSVQPTSATSTKRKKHSSCSASLPAEVPEDDEPAVRSRTRSQLRTPQTKRLASRTNNAYS